MSIRRPSLRAVLVLSWLCANTACSSSSSDDNAAGSNATGGKSSGSTAKGGAMSSGGTKPASGGAPTAGATTVNPNNGGMAATTMGNGGSTTGGVAITAAGTTSTSLGGATTGAAATGGTTPSNGGTTGSAVGGASVAGATSLSGGASANGGTSTSGTAVAGSATTAAGTAAVATGGTATGGTATGGVATGGAAGSSSSVPGAAGSDNGPPSCAGGLYQCGKDGVDDCCSTIEVPGGTFLRGRSTEACSDCVAGCPAAVRTGATCYSSETPETTVTIGAFKLDKYLVTVGRMKKFVAAYDAWRSAGNPAMWAGAVAGNQDTGFRTGWSLNMTSTGLVSGLTSCTGSKVSTYASDNDTYPVNCINWVQAFAFCIWDGGRLPTEAEWEYAAAGGSDNRLYPWGSDAPDSTRAHFDQTDPLRSVGSYPAGGGRYGHLDMAGLLWEWVMDVYDPAYYSDPNTCVNCSNWDLSSGERVLRGGGYSNSIGDGAMRATRRLSYTAIPSTASNAWGLRCAR